MKKTIALALAATTLVGAVGCGNKSADLAVDVNGTKISQKDYYDYLLRKPTFQVASQNGPVEAQVIETPGLQALRDLINRQLILQISKDMGVAPTSADIEKEITFRQKRNPNYVKQLTAQSITLELIRKDVELELAREKIITHGITVTPQEVDDYIKNNPTKFQTPAQVNALIVVVNDQAKEKVVDSDLASGQTFQVVAERYSALGNVRATGARWPRTNLDDNPPDIKAAFEATTEGKTTPWIKAGAQFAKFYIAGKTVAQPVKIDDTIKELVQRQLALQKGSAATDLQTRVAAELKKAKIDVGIEPLKASWKQVMDSLNTQQAQAAQGQTGGTTAPK